MPKKENIQSMFNDIAPEYDKLNHILSLDIDRSWRKSAVKEILKDLHSDALILDVASGTGDFAIETATSASAGCKVIGVDISEGMLSVGRSKIEKAGLNEQISLELGDCENLRFETGTFDRVTVAFGVRNFEHKELGLKEMLRILKPGGKAVILELSVPENPILLFMYKLYFLHILPAIGGAVSGNRKAYNYLPASVLNFPKPAVFAAMMRNAGFAEATTRSFTLGICRMYIGTKTK